MLNTLLNFYKRKSYKIFCLNDNHQINHLFIESQFRTIILFVRRHIYAGCFFLFQVENKQKKLEKKLLNLKKTFPPSNTIPSSISPSSNNNFSTPFLDLISSNLPFFSFSNDSSSPSSSPSSSSSVSSFPHSPRPSSSPSNSNVIYSFPHSPRPSSSSHSSHLNTRSSSSTLPHSPRPSTNTTNPSSSNLITSVSSSSGRLITPERDNLTKNKFFKKTSLEKKNREKKKLRLSLRSQANFFLKSKRVLSTSIELKILKFCFEGIRSACSFSSPVDSQLGDLKLNKSKNLLFCSVQRTIDQISHFSLFDFSLSHFLFLFLTVVKNFCQIIKSSSPSLRSSSFQSQITISFTNLFRFVALACKYKRSLDVGVDVNVDDQYSDLISLTSKVVFILKDILHILNYY